MATELAERTRNAAVQDRAELPGMSLMEHLEELRKRLFWSVGWLFAGMICCLCVPCEAARTAIQKPLVDIGLKMTMTHPTDAMNFLIKTSAVCGRDRGELRRSFCTRCGCLFRRGCTRTRRRYVFPFMGDDGGVCS